MAGWARLLLVLSGASAYVLLPRVTPSPYHVPQQLASGKHRVACSGRRCSSSAPQLQEMNTATEAEAPAWVPPGAAPVPGADEELKRVYPSNCPSCETSYLERSKVAEADEVQRLEALRYDNMSGFSYEVWEYAQRMNDTQRQELALDPDVELVRPPASCTRRLAHEQRSAYGVSSPHRPSSAAANARICPTTHPCSPSPRARSATSSSTRAHRRHR